jgi:hypothetical protein
VAYTGKTYTMEGYNYAPQKAVPGGLVRPPRVKPNSMKEKEGRALGVVPTMIAQLFDRIAATRAAQPGLRVRCRVSFVQIYKEQVYDLLAGGGGGGGVGVTGIGRVSSGRGVIPGLKMRWTKTEGFFLESLRTVECATADDVLECFREGVKHKVGMFMLLS